jgi:RNA polymerase sigma factor (sigma-70 family)
MAPPLAQNSGVDPAFERLYRRHAGDVYRYALAILRNQADAEDVTQTTFMNAYRALERGERPATPHNWLIAIAHNVCRQRFRQAARRVQEVGLEDDVADHFVTPEDDDTPTSADIRRALGHLAFNQRAALVMRELEGRSYAEIADLLEMSVAAVETLIFRARRALREQLDEALTCGQAEQLLSRQLDGELAKPDRGRLRAHLRECDGCRKLARSERAQRSALRALGAIPLPSSLASLFGGGASVGAAVAVKAAAVVVAAGVVGGLGYDAHHALVQPAAKHRRHTVVTRTQPVTVAPRHVVVSHAPDVAAAVVVPVRMRHRHGAAGSRATPAAAPPVAEQWPATAAVSATRTAAPAAEQRSSGARRRPTRSQSHEHGAAPPQTHTDAGPPPTDSGSPPSRSGKPGKAKGKTVVAVTLPELPVPAPDGLTETSQNRGARNDALWHLHP